MLSTAPPLLPVVVLYVYLCVPRALELAANFDLSKLVGAHGLVRCLSSVLVLLAPLSPAGRRGLLFLYGHCSLQFLLGSRRLRHARLGSSRSIKGTIVPRPIWLMPHAISLPCDAYYYVGDVMCDNESPATRSTLGRIAHRKFGSIRWLSAALKVRGFWMGNRQHSPRMVPHCCVGTIAWELLPACSIIWDM